MSKTLTISSILRITIITTTVWSISMVMSNPKLLNSTSSQNQSPNIRPGPSSMTRQLIKGGSPKCSPIRTSKVEDNNEAFRSTRRQTTEADSSPTQTISKIGLRQTMEGDNMKEVVEVSQEVEDSTNAMMVKVRDTDVAMVATHVVVEISDTKRLVETSRKTKNFIRLNTIPKSNLASQKIK